MGKIQRTRHLTSSRARRLIPNPASSADLCIALGRHSPRSALYTLRCPSHRHRVAPLSSDLVRFSVWKHTIFCRVHCDFTFAALSVLLLLLLLLRCLIFARSAQSKKNIKSRNLYIEGSGRGSRANPEANKLQVCLCRKYICISTRVCV